MKTHSFNCLLLGKYKYCSKCGLIALNNEVTRKAVNKACPGRED